MSSTLAPGDSDEIIERFRRLVDSNEDKKPVVSNADDFNLAQPEQNPILPENEPGGDELPQPVTPDEMLSPRQPNEMLSETDEISQPVNIPETDLSGEMDVSKPMQNNPDDFPAKEVPAIDEYGMPLPGRKGKIISSPSPVASHPSQRPLTPVKPSPSLPPQQQYRYSRGYSSKNV